MLDSNKFENQETLATANSSGEVLQEISIGEIKAIVLNSQTANVNIGVWDSPKVKIHFYGSEGIDNRDLEIDAIGEELVITQWKKEESSDCELDILIPHKFLKRLSIITTVATDVTIHKDINVEKLDVITNSGNVKSEATFSYCTISSTNGNIHFFINARNNIIAEVFTTSGNILAEFQNIGLLDILANSIKGKVRNCHQTKCGYIARARISSINGNILVK